MTRKTPSTIVIFVDRSLGSPAGAHVEVHDDHFPQETPDTNWLIEVGQRGWVVLSKDSAIRRNRAEREALHAAEVRAFFLTQQGITGPEMAALFTGAPNGVFSRREIGKNFLRSISSFDGLPGQTKGLPVNKLSE